MNEFRTRDMQMAATLVANGAPFPETQRENGRAVFIFNDDDGQIAWDVEKYRLGSGDDCMVNVRNLWKAWDELKRSLGPKPEVRR